MQTTLFNETIVNAKPFLKWAGGKSQLLDELHQRLPRHIVESGEIERYVEPFVGGGAFFFFLKSRYRVKEAFLLDINRELVIGYQAIKNNHKELINELKKIEKEYLEKTEEKRKEFFYEIRDFYNQQRIDFNYDSYNGVWIERAKYLIFLNKTCFNGLFRLNRKGEFNVPFGKYKQPKICNEKNILEVHKSLEDAKILCGDFLQSEEFIENGTLVYFDPPYRPLNPTSSFTSYSKEDFTDQDQRRLAEFYRKVDKKGAYQILSNSDPKNEDPGDNFFDELYSEYRIEQVKASRMINCDAEKRGKIYELIITNY